MLVDPGVGPGRSPERRARGLFWMTARLRMRCLEGQVPLLKVAVEERLHALLEVRLCRSREPMFLVRVTQKRHIALQVAERVVHLDGGQECEILPVPHSQQYWRPNLVGMEEWAQSGVERRILPRRDPIHPADDSRVISR